jgi:hypothetical protein
VSHKLSTVRALLCSYSVVWQKITLLYQIFYFPLSSNQFLPKPILAQNFHAWFLHVCFYGPIHHYQDTFHSNYFISSMSTIFLKNVYLMSMMRRKLQQMICFNLKWFVFMNLFTLFEFGISLCNPCGWVPRSTEIKIDPSLMYRAQLFLFLVRTGWNFGWNFLFFFVN